MKCENYKDCKNQALKGEKACQECINTYCHCEEIPY